MKNGDECIDNCASWQTITTDNQTEKQQVINIHRQNVCHSDTFTVLLHPAHLPDWIMDNNPKNT